MLYDKNVRPGYGKDSRYNVRIGMNFCVTTSSDSRKFASQSQSLLHVWGFFFKRGFQPIFAIWSKIFTCRCPSRSGVGAIDSPDRFEQVLDQRYIPEVSEKHFTHDISMIRRQKMFIFGVLTAQCVLRHSPLNEQKNMKKKRGYP